MLIMKMCERIEWVAQETGYAIIKKNWIRERTL